MSDMEKADRIIARVAEWFDVSPEEIKGSRRLKHVIDPRHLSALLIVDMTTLKLKDIGRALGGRDHATIINSSKKALYLIKESPAYKKAYDAIRSDNFDDWDDYAISAREGYESPIVWDFHEDWRRL